MHGRISKMVLHATYFDLFRNFLVKTRKANMARNYTCLFNQLLSSHKLVDLLIRFVDSNFCVAIIEGKRKLKMPY